ARQTEAEYNFVNVQNHENKKGPPPILSSEREPGQRRGGASPRREEDHSQRAARQPERAAELSGQSKMSERQEQRKSRYQQRKDTGRETMKAADKVGNTDDAAIGNSGSDSRMVLPQAPPQVSGPQHDTTRSSASHMPLPQAAPLKVDGLKQCKEVRKSTAEKAEAFNNRSAVHEGDQAAMEDREKHRDPIEDLDRAPKVKEDQCGTAITAKCYSYKATTKASRVQVRELEESIDKLRAQKAACIVAGKRITNAIRLCAKKLKVYTQRFLSWLRIFRRPTLYYFFSL
ncbi:MAG: hypothetical protein Q9208_008675, partial [Pyrenodesmia sp. 3 TL-2023]